MVSSLPTGWLFFSKGTARDKSMDPSFLCWGGDSSPPELLRGHKELLGPPGHTCPLQKGIYLLRRRGMNSDRDDPCSPPPHKGPETHRCLPGGWQTGLFVVDSVASWIQGAAGPGTKRSKKMAGEGRAEDTQRTHSGPLPAGLLNSTVTEDSSRVVGCPALHQEVTLYPVGHQSQTTSRHLPFSPWLLHFVTVL